MTPAIKLSSRSTKEFWEIPVLFEDADILALNKPAALLTAPNPADPEKPSLLALLHAAIADRKPAAAERGLEYLMNIGRLDFEVTGVVLLAKNKAVYRTLSDYFGADQARRIYLALIQGTPAAQSFEVNAKLSPDLTRPELTRVDPQGGKRALTRFELVEKWNSYSLVRAEAVTDRLHQIRVHLKHVRLPVVGDSTYGGRPLLLSRLKPNYRLKAGRTERALISSAAVHAESLAFVHPANKEPITITAPLPKELDVALRYLRRYSARP